MKDGYYWVRRIYRDYYTKEITDKEKNCVIARLDCGDWWLPGYEVEFALEELEVIGERLEEPKL